MLPDKPLPAGRIRTARTLRICDCFCLNVRVRPGGKFILPIVRRS